MHFTGQTCLVNKWAYVTTRCGYKKCFLAKGSAKRLLIGTHKIGLFPLKPKTNIQSLLSADLAKTC